MVRLAIYKRKSVLTWPVGSSFNMNNGGKLNMSRLSRKEEEGLDVRLFSYSIKIGSPLNQMHCN